MERETQKTQFLRDVRTRIKEVTTRDYINPEEETLDYVLVFIPNEQVYAFINQNDPALIDEALKSKVILCSPFTLFAILAIIRQAMDNFSTAKTANDMLRLIGGFNKEWEKFRGVHGQDGPEARRRPGRIPEAVDDPPQQARQVPPEDRGPAAAEGDRARTRPRRSRGPALDEAEERRRRQGRRRDLRSAVRRWPCRCGPWWPLPRRPPARNGTCPWTGAASRRRGRPGP